MYIVCLCSLVLNKYISILETRVSKLAHSKEVAGNVAKKVRQLGEPSMSSPPLDAPSWAVRKESINVNTDPNPEEGVHMAIFIVVVTKCYCAESTTIDDMVITNTA